jgi:hypothetical protein
MRLNVILPDEVVVRIDALVGRGSRSRWIAEACETRLGSVAERSMAADCKSVGETREGSNPSRPTKLESGAAVAQAIVNRSVAGSNPASPAIPYTPGPRRAVAERPASNVQRYREKIASVIDKTWRTPAQIAAVTGIHERIVGKMLQGMDVEWQRGTVRLK